MPKRILQGVVVSDKQEKTVVVKVERRFTHPLFKKTVRRSKNYHAHDENNQFKPGDTVWIAPDERHWHGAAPDSAIVAAARANGMRSMREDGERLVTEGVTSLEEVLRVTRD